MFEYSNCIVLNKIPVSYEQKVLICSVFFLTSRKVYMLSNSRWRSQRVAERKEGIKMISSEEARERDNLYRMVCEFEQRLFKDSLKYSLIGMNDEEVKVFNEIQDELSKVTTKLTNFACDIYKESVRMVWEDKE